MPLIDGLAGNVLVPEGTIVQANGNTPLVVLQKTGPICWVWFLNPIFQPFKTHEWQKSQG
jgi:hypothetical protein